MSDAKQIAKDIADQLVKNGEDQINQLKETFDEATKAGERAADKGVSVSPSQLWEQFKSIPSAIKESANRAAQRTVDIYHSTKHLGHTVGQLGYAVSKVPDALDGVDRFSQTIAKDVDKFQEKTQPELDKLNKLLNK